MLVKKAQEEKAPIQRLADRYAIFFTPLEQIASVRAALFDKTGTITFGTPGVEKVVSLSNMTEEDVLYRAAIIEQFSSHSIATAIVKKALQTGKTLPLPKRVHEIPGRGVEGEIDGQHYFIGSYDFIENRIGKENTKNLQSMITCYYEEGKSLIFLGKDCTCMGFLVISDTIRPHVPVLMERLHDLGVKEIVMITGDGKKNAQAIAKQAGIEKYEAELLPEQKVNIVRKFRDLYKSVLMVGDGINDAPALGTATVGIAMGAYGTAISAESADIVLLVDDLSKVADAISIGKRMLHIAKQSIFIGMGLSFLLMIIAVFWFIPPPLGAMLQEIIDIAVILNALRAR